MAWKDRKKGIEELEHLKLKIDIDLQRLEGVISALAGDWRNTANQVPATMSFSDNAGRYDENAVYFETLLNDIKEINKWLKAMVAEPNKTKSTNPATKNW